MILFLFSFSLIKALNSNGLLLIRQCYTFSHGKEVIPICSSNMNFTLSSNIKSPLELTDFKKHKTLFLINLIAVKTAYSYLLNYPWFL